MAATSRYSWPTPDPGDTPDVPGDMADLANAVEEALGSIDDRLTTLTGSSQSVFQYTSLTSVTSNWPPTIQDSLWTPISFDAAQINLPASSPGYVQQSPTRITCQDTGIYRLSGFAGFALNAANSRALAFRVNGNPSYPALASVNAVYDMSTYLCINCEVRVNKNDWIELCVRQSSGTALKLDTVRARFSMQRVV